MTGRPPLFEFAADEGDSLQCVAFEVESEDPILVTGSDKGRVQAWNLGASGRKVTDVADHARQAYRVATPRIGDRLCLASGHADGTLVVADLAGEVRHRIEHPGAVYAVASDATGDEPIVVTGCGDGRVRQFDAADGSSHWTSQPTEGAVLGVAYDDGLVAAALEAGGVILLQSDRVVLRLADEVPFQEVALSRSLIAASDREGRIWLWDRDGSLRTRVSGHDGWVLGVALLEPAGLVASCDEHGHVCIHDLERGELVDSFTAHDGRALDVAWGYVGNRVVLATAGTDGPARVWEIDVPVAAAPPPRDQVEWLADAPSREDLLGRRHMARALATRLKRLSDDDPATSFLIHVDGPWGAGKSTVLELLADELGDGWLLVRFDAWRQSRVGPPWWALLMALRSAVLAERGRAGRARLRVREAGNRGRRAGAPYLLALVLLLVAATAIFVALKPQEVDAQSLGDLARTVSAVVAALATLWAGARLAGRFLFWDSATGARVYEQSAQDPMERLADHFGWLVGAAEQRALFLIDDLDRCNEQYVVELLDAVQTLVRDAGSRPAAPAGAAARAPYFVVAADGAWIRRSYEAAYEPFGDVVGQVGRPLGYLFLDKIFQITVQVPGMSEEVQERYLSRLLLGSSQDGARQAPAGERERVEAEIRESSDESEVLAALRSTTPEVRATVAATAVDKLTAPELEAATEHALQRYAPLLEPNPRAMKRFVNAYSVARAAAVLEDQLVDRGVLAAWTILRMRWPELADHLRERPDDVGRLDAGSDPPDDAPESLAPLFDDARVHRVVAFDDGHRLTPELIDQLCGRGAP